MHDLVNSLVTLQSRPAPWAPHDNLLTVLVDGVPVFYAGPLNDPESRAAAERVSDSERARLRAAAKVARAILAPAQAGGATEPGPDADRWWQCSKCGTRHAGPDLDLASIQCACGVGEGLWGMRRKPAPVTVPADAAPAFKPCGKPACGACTETGGTMGELATDIMAHHAAEAATALREEEAREGAPDFRDEADRVIRLILGYVDTRRDVIQRALAAAYQRGIEARTVPLDEATRMEIARELVLAMYLYAGHKIDSRGPTGCIYDAIKRAAPAVAADLDETMDYRTTFARFWDDGQLRPGMQSGAVALVEPATDPSASYETRARALVREILDRAIVCDASVAAVAHALQEERARHEGSSLDDDTLRILVEGEFLDDHPIPTTLGAVRALLEQAPAASTAEIDRLRDLLVTVDGALDEAGAPRFVDGKPDRVARIRALRDAPPSTPPGVLAVVESETHAEGVQEGRCKSVLCTPLLPADAPDSVLVAVLTPGSDVARFAVEVERLTRQLADAWEATGQAGGAHRIASLVEVIVALRRCAEAAVPPPSHRLRSIAEALLLVTDMDTPSDATVRMTVGELRSLLFPVQAVVRTCAARAEALAGDAAGAAWGEAGRMLQAALDGSAPDAAAVRP